MAFRAHCEAGPLRVEFVYGDFTYSEPTADPKNFAGQSCRRTWSRFDLLSLVEAIACRYEGYRDVADGNTVTRAGTPFGLPRGHGPPFRQAVSRIVRLEHWRVVSRLDHRDVGTDGNHGVYGRRGADGPRSSCGADCVFTML